VILTGRRRDPRLTVVTVALTAELLCLGGLVRDETEAASMIARALDSGAAAERFARMVSALGGPTDLVEHPERHLRPAPVQRAVTPTRAGVVTGVDARALGLLLADLGGGRRRVEDTIDVAVGLSNVRGVGDVVAKDQSLAVIHARTAADAEAGAAALRRAISVGEGASAPTSPVLRRLALGAAMRRP